MDRFGSLPVFLLTAVGKLLYVKWLTQWPKSWLASSRHSIGTSMLAEAAAAPPAPSPNAAISFARAYGKAVWQAMLLVGSGVQALRRIGGILAAVLSC